MARSRDYKSIRYDSAIDGHCAACSSSNLRQASSNRRSMSRGWLAERTGTTRPRRRRRAVRHMPYLPHRTHQLALRARRGSQQERHRLSAGPQRKPSSSFFFSRDARQCECGVRGMQKNLFLFCFQFRKYCFSGLIVSACWFLSGYGIGAR